MALRVLALAIWMLILVSKMPSSDFGIIVIILAISTVCSLLAPFGIPYMFFSDAYIQVTSQARWCESLGTQVMMCPMLAYIGALFFNWWVDSSVSFFAVLIFMFVEVFCVSLVQSAGLWSHSKGYVGIAAGLPAILVISRLIPSLLLIAFYTEVGSAIIEWYMVIHAVISSLTTLILLIWVTRATDLIWQPKLPSLKTLSYSWRYAAMGVTALSSSELDKPILSSVLGLQQLGYYTVAHRICLALTMPATALSATMLPKWVSILSNKNTVIFKRSFIRVLIVVALMGGVLVLCLHTALYIFPAGSFGLYTEAWFWISGLSWLIIIIGLRVVVATALLALSLPLTRALVDLLGLFVLTILAFLVYPNFGVKGVIIASIFSEGFVLMLMLLFVVSRISKINDREALNGK